MFNSLMTSDQRYFGGAAGLRYESIVETLLSSRAALDTTDYEGGLHFNLPLVFL